MMIQRFRQLSLLSAKIILGVLLGLLLLEGIFYLNPRILLRGMPAPAPVDRPLTTTKYTVRYSDADVFEWRPELIQPILPEQDLVEASVIYQTDEFGFRNTPGLPESIDMVVLGRSTSAGAQVNLPWPLLLQSTYGLQILNLSQPSSDTLGKKLFYEKFGAPRKPTWLIIEINPQLDIIGVRPRSSLVSQLPTPIIKQLIGRFATSQNKNPAPDESIFPLRLTYPDRTEEIICCTHYMEFYSLDRESLQKSRDWKLYSEQLLKIAQSAANWDTCVALLYVPVKQVIYLAEINDLDQLNPIFNHFNPYQVDPQGTLSSDGSRLLSPAAALNKLYDARDLIQSFSAEHNLLWIDPSQAFLDAYRGGSDPFMKYDNHWNQYGHNLIAEVVAQNLLSTPCP